MEEYLLALIIVLIIVGLLVLAWRMGWIAKIEGDLDDEGFYGYYRPYYHAGYHPYGYYGYRPYWRRSRWGRYLPSRYHWRWW